jgi:L-methionine (R)-S-oxide reductase
MSHTSSRYDFKDKAGDYARLAQELESLLAGERDPIANAANTASLIFNALPEVNWAGFYLLKDGELVVGPFQGKPACVRIELGKGVCGTAAAERRTVLVPDVHAFPGHIACDEASRSEIVVPLVRLEKVACGPFSETAALTAGKGATLPACAGELFGVLDLDSPRVARFDDVDRRGLERLAAIFLSSVT